jgi:FdhD protein
MDRSRAGGQERTHTAPTASTIRIRGSVVEQRDDRLVGEEPLEIKAAGPALEPVSIAVTMRTPGSEADLAAGFLVTEGLARQEDICGFEFGDVSRMSQPDNELTVRLRQPIDPAAIPSRAFIATASCGICGKASLDDVEMRCDPVSPGPRVSRSVLLTLPHTMRGAQQVFDRTGGLHAAALFDPDGMLRALREDIGRHNALDKVIGHLVQARELPLHESVLLVSGRVSFEITQKAAMAGIPIVAAVSAPSDLAVSLAARLGMTLVGFLRDDGFNVYAGADRLDLDG